MVTAAEAIRSARLRAGLTQAEVAKRLGTTQSAVARLESPGSNPTVATVERALEATGHRLMLAAARAERGVDDTLIADRLRMTPDERLRSFEAFSSDMRRITLAGRRSGGDERT
jgi:transcriptional regulator with XRE-family HTH domain